MKYLLFFAAMLLPVQASAEETTCPSRELVLPPIATLPDNFFELLSTFCAAPTGEHKARCERLTNGELTGLEDTDLHVLRDWIAHRGKLAALVERRKDIITGSILLPALTNGGMSLAKGFGDFVTKRAEEEASAFLQQEMTDRVCGAPELRCAFPRLCDLMTKNELRVGLGGMAQALRKAGELDIHHLPDYMLAKAMTAPGVDQSVKSAAPMLRLLWATVLAAQQGRQPLAVIAALTEVKDEALCGGACPKELATLRIAAHLISTISRLDGLDRDSGQENIGMLTVVLGLLLESGAKEGLPQIRFDRESIKKLVPVVTKIFPLVLKASEEIQASAELARAADPKLSELRAPSPLLSAALIWQMTSAARELLEQPSAIHGCSGDCLVTAKAAFTKVELGAEALTQISPNDPASIFWALSSLLSRLDLGKNSKTALSASALRAGAVIVELARADSSDGVVRALEAASAPVGSYRAKYQRPTFAINAFVGGHVGAEFLVSSEADSSSTVGAFVPIGVHVSWPALDQHFGLMAAVADLGAFANVRLGDDEQTSVTPEPRPLQIFTPGLYFVWGMFGSPFALGLGASITPEAREVVEGGSSDVVRPIAIRAGGFLAVDVTIVPF